MCYSSVRGACHHTPWWGGQTGTGSDPPRVGPSSLLSNKPLELSVLPVSGVSERGEAFLSSVYFFLFGGACGAGGGLRLISWDPQAAACQPPPPPDFSGCSCRCYTVNQKTWQLPHPPCPNMVFYFSYSLKHGGGGGGGVLTESADGS